jgi:hypothetical protein
MDDQTATDEARRILQAMRVLVEHLGDLLQKLHPTAGPLIRPDLEALRNACAGAGLGGLVGQDEGEHLRPEVSVPPVADLPGCGPL